MTPKSDNKPCRLAMLSIAVLTFSACADPAQDLLNRMTIDEKIKLLHGRGWAGSVYVGYADGVPRLGIPPVKLNDGPQGYRCNGIAACPPGSSTAFPSGMTAAATWDVDAVEEWGKAIGKEFYMKGANVALGPGLNVARLPWGGRNFEYISGEDPYLGKTLAGPAVKGIQSQGVVANAKHWVLNNQENNRVGISEVADERTRYEIYYPPFKGAIDAGVGSVMCSYNKVNGVYSCENSETLQTDLKGRLGFKGFVTSDWRATHTTSILEGLDQEMPDNFYMNEKVLNQSKYSAAVDASVLRILRPLISVGAMNPNRPNISNDQDNVSTPESMKVARDVSTRATVLAKNHGSLLPLNRNAVRRIAVIGKDAVTPRVGGGGSGKVVPSYLPPPLESIKSYMTQSTPSCSPKMNNTDVRNAKLCAKNPGGIAGVSNANDCCQLCQADETCMSYVYQPSASHCYTLSASGATFSNNDRVFATVRGEVFYAKDDIDGKDLAAGADVAIVFISAGAAEGYDRALDFGPQDDMVRHIASVQPNTIVSAVAPGYQLYPWESEVKSILMPFFPGQMYGDAITDILFGEKFPAGRLPVTIPYKREADNHLNMTEDQYPGINGVSHYTEGLFVGYRWYDAHNVSAHFCFGHGLSYTSFSYSNLVVHVASGQVTVSVSVKNNGTVAGNEVPQLYLGYPKAAQEPPKVLRGFQNIAFTVGETKTVTFILTDEDMSVWDPSQHKWQRSEGEFVAMVGASSCDIRLTKSFTPAASAQLFV